MNYIYVLSSNELDFYYEQFLLSAASLRLYNPDAVIIVLIDSKTKEGLKEKRSGYKTFITEEIIISVPPELSQKEASRWIKTSIQNYIKEEFLYIDCDTVVTAELKKDFSNDISIGAVLDNHVNLKKHHLKDHFTTEDKKAGFSSSLKTNLRYNGGLIYSKNDSKAVEFFEKLHFLWINGKKHGCSQDMPSLNQANYKMNNIITELPGEWNCQISHNGLSFLYNAKIIHYYATGLQYLQSPFLPASNTVLSSIKETGTISEEIMELLKNPKTAFEQESRIIAGEAELDLTNSKLFSLFLRIRKRKPKLFKAFNSLITRSISAWKKN